KQLFDRIGRISRSKLIRDSSARTAVGKPNDNQAPKKWQANVEREGLMVGPHAGGNYIDINIQSLWTLPDNRSALSNSKHLRPFRFRVDILLGVRRTGMVIQASSWLFPGMCFF